LQLNRINTLYGLPVLLARGCAGWRPCLFFLLSLLVAIPGIADWHRYEFEVMGTAAAVELWNKDVTRARQVASQVEAEMRRIETVMSPYIVHSELSAINRLPQGKELVVSPETYQVIKTAQEIALASDGVFDISFASVGFLYDYRKQKRPTEAELDSALGSVDYRSILIAEKNRAAGESPQYSITFARDGMRLDLGGIAKGYAVDRSIDILLENGILSGLVSAGGDSRLLGNRGVHRETGEILPWMTGIRHPRDDTRNALRLPLSDTAISTSGDYERFFLDGDERVHHIVNTNTGQSTSGIASATVIGEKSIYCDALATAVFASGVVSGLALIEKFDGYDAIVIDATGKVHYSSGLYSGDTILN